MILFAVLCLLFGFSCLWSIYDNWGRGKEFFPLHIVCLLAGIFCLWLGLHILMR